MRIEMHFCKLSVMQIVNRCFFVYVCRSDAYQTIIVQILCIFINFHHRLIFEKIFGLSIDYVKVRSLG